MRFNDIPTSTDSSERLDKYLFTTKSPQLYMGGYLFFTISLFRDNVDLVRIFVIGLQNLLVFEIFKGS